MKRLLFVLGICLILCVTFSGIVLASDISNAKYYGVIVATNNSTAATVVSTNVSGLNTTEMIAQGWLNSSANNCAIRNSSGADVPFMPGYGTNPWDLFITSIGNYSQLSYTFYTDNATGGTLAYFPTPTGMSVNDTALMEPSSNFTDSFTGYIDMTQVGYPIYYKKGAVGTYVSSTTGLTVSNNYTFDAFYTDTWTDTTTLIAVNVTNTRFEYVSQRSAVDDRSYFDLGANVVSDTGWIKYFNFSNNATAGTTPILGYGLWSAATNLNAYAGDALIVEMTYTAGNTALYIQSIDAGAATTSGSGITITNGTTYYCTFQRNSAVLATLSVYSDVSRTTHITGSPITLAIPGAVTGLRYLQASNYNDGAGAGWQLTGWIDDVSLVPNSASSFTSATTGGAVTLAVSYAANRIINSSFETGDPPWGWTAQPGITFNQSALHAVYGAYSTNITLYDGSWWEDGIYQEIGPIADYQGKSVTFGVWAFNPVTNTKTAAIKIYDGVSTTWSANIPHDGALHFVTVTKTVSAVAPYLRLYMSPNNEGDAVQTVYFDGAIMIVSSSLPNQYYNFNLYVNGTITGQMAIDSALAVPDNSNNTTICSPATSYMTAATFTKGGVLRGSWAWNYGATFTDLSGNGNTGYPTFRTTSSDPDVSAMLSLYSPVTIPEAPPFVVGEGPNWYSGNVTMSGNFTTGNVTLNYPFKGMIDGLSTATATPSQLPLTFISGFVIIALSLLTSGVMRNFGGGSAFVKAIVLFAGFGACIAVQIYDFWMVFFLAIFVVTVLFASRERSSS